MKRLLLLVLALAVVCAPVIASETSFHQLVLQELAGADPYLILKTEAGASWGKLLLNETGTTFDITTLTAGIGIVFDAADAAAGTANTYYDFTGTFPAHTTGTLTDYLLKLTPTIGIATAATTTQYVEYMSFTTPVWTTGTHTLVGLQISPTIGNASGGTNAFTAFAIGNITGDAQVTETAFSIGTGYDTGFSCGSPVTFTGGISLSGGVINLNASSNYAVNIATGTSTGAVTVGGTAGNVIAVGADNTVADDIDIGSALDDLDLEGEDITLDTADDGNATVADDWTFTMESANGIFAVGGTLGWILNLGTDDTTADTFNVGSAKDDVNVTGATVNLVGGNSATAITLTTNSGTSEQIAITNTLGTSVSAIDITATAGGVDIDGVLVQMDSTDDMILQVTSSTDGEDLYIAQVGGNNSSILVSAAGTGADAISLQATGGSVDVDAADDIAIDAVDNLTLNGGSAGSIISIGTNVHGNVVNVATDDTAADAINVGSAKDTLTVAGVAANFNAPVKGDSFTVDDGSEDVKIDSDNQTATLPTITIPDFTDATADFLVTNTFTTTLPFAGGLRGEDTDAAGTNGGGLIGGAPDITTHTYTNATDDVWVLVYDAGTTTWDALATSALLNGGADWAANWQLQPDADAEAAGDAFAIGFATKFCEVVFDDLATGAGALATYAADCGKYQYSTGAGTWSDLTVFDNTDATAYDGKRTLQRTGAITFVPPADWVTATYDGQLAYWIQWVVTDAQLTQTALIDSTNKDEPFIAVPNADTFSAPFKLEITKVRVTNMHTTVHDQNIVFVVANFTDGVYSAAQTWTASQLNDKFTLGTAIAADPGDLIGICVTNDTASTNNPVWAVEFEVTYED